jgi:hypothetical protein
MGKPLPGFPDCHPLFQPVVVQVFPGPPVVPAVDRKVVVLDLTRDFCLLGEFARLLRLVQLEFIGDDHMLIIQLVAGNFLLGIGAAIHLTAEAVSPLRGRRQGVEELEEECGELRSGEGKDEFRIDV